ncbi:alpha-L-rhamnosidase [Arsenicitalea aurantiaca]|uniref:alpha-L-rhamnosidase n=1 Tax=Arsenicitalea aurantiaca TaxID=1783274 RepID=A0A433X2N0_9HYPH|nr:alpha-L-rhamnosidase [Arsenicitalea aurantiaca]RUT28345.1 alpha-L-rhamnosidase [Arsenicitalea aurantiaca]
MSRLTVSALRCEHLATPLGLNTKNPRLSWSLAGTDRGLAQSAYRIVVGSDAEAVAKGIGALWDTGRVEGPRPHAVHYAGRPLGSDERLYWSVMVWDETGAPSPFAAPAAIETGLDPADWRAGWIARYFVLPAGREVPADNAYDNRWQARPADHFRRDFTLDRPILRATAYLSALGLYRLHVNGARIGDEVMAPGWTDYHQRVPYQVLDLTDRLVMGENCIGAICGEGWYSGRVGHNQRRAGNHYGGRPAFLCQIEIHYADGGRETLVTDEHWQTAQGPVCYSDFLMGERYDARLERPGWDRPGHDVSRWQPVERFVPDPRAPHLDAARVQPAREIARFAARFLHEVPDGGRIYDLGQNIAGYVELALTAPRGAEFTLRHAETLDETGGLYTANLRHAVATDHYVAKGEGRETWSPHFTFHGFRYIELFLPEGVAPEAVSLTGIAIQSDTPLSGRFETGHAMVNQLWSNILWSQRGNFLSVPTDCPQRDERYGWTADAQVFWKTAGYGMDVAAFLEKWMEDIADAQLPDGAYTDVAPSRPLNPYRLTGQPGAPGWGDGPIIMAHQHWLRYGDRDLIARHYRRFVAWMDHVERANPDFLRRGAVYNNYGDWLSVGPASDRTMVATAYWIHIADLMAAIAGVLHLSGDVARFTTLGARIRAAFLAAFVDDDTRITGDTQTAYLLALDFDCLPPEHRPAARAHLRARIEEAGGHLQTGFLGVRHLCPVLADAGAPDLAMALLFNDSYPSWGFSIRHGATTIWERWDGWTPEKGFQSAAMNSFNHYAYGSVGEFLFARLAGIDWSVEGPGFEIVRMRPIFDRRLGYVRAHYDAHAGRVESSWTYEGERIQWSIALPPGTRADIALPLPADRISLDHAPLAASLDLSGLVEAAGITRFSCPSGRYVFTLTP